MLTVTFLIPATFLLSFAGNDYSWRRPGFCEPIKACIHPRRLLLRGHGGLLGHPQKSLMNFLPRPKNNQFFFLSYKLKKSLKNSKFAKIGLRFFQCKVGYTQASRTRSDSLRKLGSLWALMALCTFPFDRCLMGFKLFITPKESRRKFIVEEPSRAEGYAKEPFRHLLFYILSVYFSCLHFCSSVSL